MGARGVSIFWSRWRADRRGVSAVEFALVMPLLLLVYVGGAEVSQALSTYRKLIDTTSELANITSQYTTMAASDVSGVMSASAQVMAPYPTANLSIVLSEISTNANSQATVIWSRSYNGATPLTVGASYTLPTGMAQPNISYILVETVYTYVPAVATTFVGTIPMSSQIYVQPRQSSSIPYTG
jgi:Flp pilus assembly protein TadG